MNSNSITRSQFRAAIEAGIAACGGIACQDALRGLAATATRTAVGSFNTGPGCPLAQVNASTAGGGTTFAIVFDEKIRRLGAFGPVVTIREDRA